MESTITQTILLIDDNEDDVLLTKRVIFRISPELRIESATDGATGLALLRGGGPLPSLILLDLKMPGMSGFDVLRAIRTDARTTHIPVIVVTSSDLESDRKDAREAGADGFIHKAFDVEQFSEEINFVVSFWIKK